MQGRLRKEALDFSIETECGHCHQPLHIDIDSELNYRVQETEASPLVYSPMMDEKKKASEPSIIDFF